jgi:hypothetical protein
MGTRVTFVDEDGNRLLFPRIVVKPRPEQPCPFCGTDHKNEDCFLWDEHRKERSHYVDTDRW